MQGSYNYVGPKRDFVNILKTLFQSEVIWYGNYLQLVFG